MRILQLIDKMADEMLNMAAVLKQQDQRLRKLEQAVTSFPTAPRRLQA